MQMTAVYSCVRILAEAIAGLPLHLYKYTDSGGKEKAIDYPLYLLLHDEPNPEMSSFVFRETLMTHLLLWGNAYAQIIRNGKGEVVALYPLMPNKMTVDFIPVLRGWHGTGHRHPEAIIQVASVLFNYSCVKSLDTSGIAGRRVQISNSPTRYFYTFQLFRVHLAIIICLDLKTRFSALRSFLPRFP